MTTTHDDDATTWRDLTHQLTPAHVEHAVYPHRIANQPDKPNI